MRALHLPAVVVVTSLLQSTLALLHCTDVVADGVNWNITALEGARTVERIDEDDTPPTNTTFRFDLCRTLHHYRNDDEKGCMRGSWVCGFKRLYDPEKKETQEKAEESWSIAGTYTKTGGQLEERFERIKSSSSSSEAEQDLEGVRIHYHGGKRNGQPTKMIAELICDKEKQQTLARRSGTTPAWNLLRRDPKDTEDDEGDDDDDKEDMGEENTKPEFVSYKSELIPGDKKNAEHYVLRIKWKTIHACENSASNPGSGGGGSWGFFTWLIIVLFLLVAAYLIFGSWLNYNRHGARGWDLLPHGDTIRDIPYLLKDWGRAIIDTVQGTHSRGGYNQI